MTVVNNFSYIQRQFSPRDWWIVKCNTDGKMYVGLGNVYFPKSLAGKRVRFKVEVIDDSGNKH